MMDARRKDGRKVMSVLDKEVWKNVAGGVRWIITLDAIGNRTTTVVQPGRTFTISAIERRLNQESVYDEKVDPFRDGTFLLMKDTDDTIPEEIASPDSLSDQEIAEAVTQAVKQADPVPIELMLERTDSLITTERIFEELVLQDASQSLVAKARSKVEALTPKPIGTDGEPVVVGDRTTIVDVPPGPNVGKKDPKWKVAIE